MPFAFVWSSMVWSGMLPWRLWRPGEGGCAHAMGPALRRSRGAARRWTRCASSRPRSPTARGGSGAARRAHPAARQRRAPHGWLRLGGPSLAGTARGRGARLGARRDRPGGPVLVALAAVRAVSGLGPGARTPSVVARRFGLGASPAGGQPRPGAGRGRRRRRAGAASERSTSSAPTTSSSPSTRPTRRGAPPTSRRCARAVLVTRVGAAAATGPRRRRGRAGPHSSLAPPNGWACTKELVSAYIRWMYASSSVASTRH